MNSTGWKCWLAMAVLSALLGSEHRVRSVLAEEAEPAIGVLLDSSRCPVSFEATGLSPVDLEVLKTLRASDPGFADVLSVYVVDHNHDAGKESDPLNSNVPSISGQYKIEGTRVIFTPRHPFRPGLTYRAVLKVQNSAVVGSGTFARKPFHRDVTVPLLRETDVVSPSVEAIYPSADTLPENLLRIYIHFSKPMIPHEAYRNLELQDESGQPIEAPFLELEEELWDPSGRRFTLLLDPGRVKHGLKPREELGPVLEAKLKYTLVVKQSWRDENGNKLESEFRKTFIAGPASDQAIHCTEWKLFPPAVGTRDPLIVEFHRILDHALLTRTLSIEDLEGRRVKGNIVVARGETGWRFEPTDAWKAGPHFLVVDNDLEDPTGNRIDRSFEVSRQNFFAADPIEKSRRIRFEIREPVASSTGRERSEN